MEMNLDRAEEKISKCNIVCKEELQEFGCDELGESSKKAEGGIVELELEIQKQKSEYVMPEEAEYDVLENENLAIGDEIKGLKGGNDEVRDRRSCHMGDERKVSCEGEIETERVVDLTGDDDDDQDLVVQLMIENKVLECEKKRAESEVEVWKKKFKELELWVSQLGERPVSQGVEQPSNGKTKVGLGCLDVDCHEVSGKEGATKAVKVYDEPNAGMSLSQLQSKLKVEDSESICTPDKGMSLKHTAFNQVKSDISLESEVKHGKQVKRHLAFEEEKGPCKKIAPSTPGGARPPCLCIIDICDSDEEPAITHTQVPSPDSQRKRKAFVSTDHALGETVCIDRKMISGSSPMRQFCEQSYDKNMMDVCIDPFSLPTPKRRRASNVITSDSESTDDDDLPICNRERMHLRESVLDKLNSNLSNCSAAAPSEGDPVIGARTPTRRRLVTLRQCEREGLTPKSSSSNTTETKPVRGIPTVDDVEDDEPAEVGSDSEGESLNGFIVHSSDVSDGDGNSTGTQDDSDGDMAFDEILSRLNRNEHRKTEWEFEADMLAAFGKDPELCMKAVCALYRQQTSEERQVKEALHQNQRGFSKFDALRGTTLAEFLTDGDPQGDLKKSVKQLQQYDPKAVEMCRRLATHYSKQLFGIYKNKEDPLFLPS